MKKIVFLNLKVKKYRNTSIEVIHEFQISYNILRKFLDKPRSLILLCK